MAITLTGSGGLFTILGHIYGRLTDLNALMGGPPTPRVGSSGSGGTVTLTVGSTIVTATAVGAGGTGYPASSLFLASPVQAGGSGCVFVCVTNSSGVITAMLFLTGHGGTGYTAATVPLLALSAGASYQAAYTTFIADAAAATPNQEYQWDGYYSQLGGWQGQQTSIFQALAGIAGNILTAIVNANSALPNPSLQPALQALQAYFVTNSDTINQSTIVIGAQAASGTPVGNAVIASSYLNSAGYQSDTVFPETLTMACTADSYTGSQTLNQEQLLISGQPSVASSAYNWPGGSGAALSLNAIDASTYGAQTQLLTNGSFAIFTNANIPDNWIAAVGAVGTQIIQGSVNYDGAYSLGYVGDSSSLTSVYQPFNTTPSTTLGSGGTLAVLTPSTVYAVNFWMRVNTTPAAGALKISLCNSSGTVITNAAGSNNAFITSLTSLSTSWVNVQGFFQTPVVLPSGNPRVYIALSTALSTSTTLYIDRFAMTPAQQLYGFGSPYVAVFSGSIPLVLNDTWTVGITNNFGVVAEWLERTFGMKSLGVFLPSTSSNPTISDGLVT